MSLKRALPRWRRPVMSALAAWILLAFACTPVSPGRTLILITIDTLRADHLGAYGYPRGTSPAFDRFARSAVLFLDCRSVSSWTMPAVGTLATGLRPNDHGLVYWQIPLSDGTPTVAELLADAGVVSAFFGNLIPQMDGIERGFEKWEGFEGDDAAVVDAATAWIRKDTDRDRFLWVHLLSPHGPYDPLPGSSRPDLELEERVVAYDGEVSTIDLLLDRLLEALDDEAAVLMTADHGETLDEREGFEFDHGNFLYEELLRVPCVARFPGYEPRRLVEEAIVIADIPATICRWFGEEPPPGAYGSSLLPVLAGGRPVPRDTTFALVVEDDPPERHDRLWSVRIGDMKTVFNLDEDTVRLFDLDTDPGEFRDVANQRPDVVSAHRRALNDWRAKSPDPEIPFHHRFTREEIQRLNSLGYLGGKR